MSNPQIGSYKINKENSLLKNCFQADLVIALIHGELKILKSRWGEPECLDPHLSLDILIKALRTGAMGFNPENFNMFKEAIEQELREEIMKVLNKYKCLDEKKKRGK